MEIGVGFVFVGSASLNVSEQVRGNRRRAQFVQLQ